MKKLFSDRIAVVTGAGGTICSEVSKRLAADGAALALVGRTAAKLEKAAGAISEAGVECECFECDVTKRDAVNALAEKVISRFGKVDFLVNGAGGNQTAAVPSVSEFDPAELDENRPEGLRGLYNVDSEAFENVLIVNTMGTFYPTLAFAKYMVRSGFGSIVNFASMNTYCPLTKNFAYAMSKAAVANLTMSLAAYFGKTGVRINAVAPGFVVNERSRTILGTVEEGLTERGKKVIAHTPMGRFGKACDMYGLIRFLLDESSSAFITGVTVPADGGFLTLSGV